MPCPEHCAELCLFGRKKLHEDKVSSHSITQILAIVKVGGKLIHRKNSHYRNGL